MKKVRILAVQYKPIYLNIKANLQKIERIIKKYKYLNPDLVIFPEYSLTGPLYSNYNLALKETDDCFQKLKSLALKYDINLIPGTFIIKKKNKKFNSSCFINSSGDILGFYNKQYLWSSEKVNLSPGNKSFLFKTSVGNIAIQICADLHSSKISMDYRKLKPDLIINLAMWSLEDTNERTKKVPQNIQLLQTEYLSRARAIENKAFVVFCNHGGKTIVKAKTGRIYPETSIGNTMVVNPYGEIVAMAGTNKERIVFSEIDLSEAHWSQYNY